MLDWNGWDENEVEFDPRQACVIKNMGPKLSEGFVLPEPFMGKIYEAERRRIQFIEAFVMKWLQKSPGHHPGQLVVEEHRGADGFSLKTVVRVLAGAHWWHGRAGAGPVVIEVPALKVKVV